jgi:hypothetical protein
MPGGEGQIGSAPSLRSPLDGAGPTGAGPSGYAGTSCAIS